MHHIIALVGMCGSGKSVVADYLEQKKGYARIHFGDVVMEELKKRGLQVLPENEKIVRESLREELGMESMAVLNLLKIEQALKKGNVVIDGLYSWSEYKVLEEKFGKKLMILLIFTPKKIRYERLEKRSIRPLTVEESIKRDHQEIENIEKGGPIAMADEVIVNDGDEEALKQKVDEVLDQIKNIEKF